MCVCGANAWVHQGSVSCENTHRALAWYLVSVAPSRSQLKLKKIVICTHKWFTSGEAAVHLKVKFLHLYRRTIDSRRRCCVKFLAMNGVRCVLAKLQPSSRRPSTKCELWCGRKEKKSVWYWSSCNEEKMWQDNGFVSKLLVDSTSTR